MSKSRLEKFLYALYSLDSSDLPNPLSRIEELYKCLVTGDEAPTFEPLSRVEKYLMAILGSYDVELLPNPLSRVEVLLYKLATGDDNLDDFKSFLSEHEELLAEIIRNGGVGGNIDIEYVLYTLSTEFNTLYNTAKKPVKSAILKGNTGYRDIDTGEVLDAFEDGRNLELVSVKMPVLTTSNLGNLVSMYNLEQGGLFNNTGVETNTDFIRSDFIEVEYAKYTLSHNRSGWTKIFEYDENKNFIRMTNTRADKHTTEVTNTTRYIRAVIELPYSQVNSLNISLCPSESTNKEPYKSNILTANEEVELRGIGEVRDELNLLTGELTQRINEIILNGSEEWTLYENDMPSVISFYTSDVLPNALPASPDSQRRMALSDALVFKDQSLRTDEEFLFISTSGKLNLNIKKSKLSAINATGFKSYLASNPLTVQYQLATESVKTVDLSIVDQDGNNTKLSTFDDLTHVTLSSEGLIPEAELEVATKNEEVLNTMSLEMDYISTIQNTLKETSNAQGENVDATMIATTEIYERLL